MNSESLDALISTISGCSTSVLMANDTYLPGILMGEDGFGVIGTVTTNKGFFEVKGSISVSCDSLGDKVCVVRPLPEFDSR